jgi:hypothetical protein
MKPGVEVLNPLQQLIRTLCNFFLRPESDLDRLGEVPGIRSLQPGPSSLKTSGVVVLLDSHRTPFPVLQGFDPDRLQLAYLQGVSP